MLQKKRLNLLFAAVALTAAGLGVSQIAHAGAGWGDTTNPSPDPSISAKDSAGAIKIRTYYANSPMGVQIDALTGLPTRDTGNPLRKFIDPLPGLVAPGGNGITVAIPDTSTYADADYYEIAVVEYTQQMHSDLAKATTLRGYVQIDPQATDAAAGLSNGALTPAGSLAKPLTNLDGTPVLISRPHNNDGTFVQVQAYAFDVPHYLGPTIVAAHGRPTRVKFYNGLPAGHSFVDPVTGTLHRAGDLFIPVDHTLFGAGDGQDTLPVGRDILCGDVLAGPNNAGDPTLSACLGGPNPDGTNTPQGYIHVPSFTQYTENREELHLHGGDNPWLSDGHPHQWITPPADELNGAVGSNYRRGSIAYNVPDMPDPGPGAVTYYWPNGQSGRLLFFHDHATGLTRLNVYAGTAAGYLLTDASERALNAFAPGGEIPLVIQDKTFVPKDITTEDARWDTVRWGQEGDLWFPHVYETNQDPLSADGTNPVGRWDGASWFWPVFPQTYATPSGVYGDVTTTPEAFMDTPVVNGMAYPTVTVDPKPYRFRILGVGNDRMLNLGLYVADATPANTRASDGAQTEVRMVPFNSPNATTATTYACPDGVSAGQTVGAINANGTVTQVGWTESGPNSSGVTLYNTSFPCAGGVLGTGWGQADNRPGGVPDPASAGPAIVRIGNEGGLFQQPVVIPSTPINYEYNKRSVTVLNVLERGLWLGPAERADVVIDFSAFAGKTLIVYNDSGAPVPAGDPRIDYYTGDGDQTGSGGAPNTLPGYGPNTRTIMQIKVNAGTGTPLDLAGLSGALISAYVATQPKPVVPTPEYAPLAAALTAAGQPSFAATAPYEHIFTGAIYLNKYNALTIPAAPDAFNYTPAPVCNTQANCLTALAAIRAGANNGLVTAVPGTPVSAYVESKAIQELFEPDYGRMNATLGVELPFTSVNIQTTIPLAYVDPATETINNGETQFWKITHNGVDSHPVHFHFINVQVINRVGWDGTIKPIPADEVGWKETVKMHPLEDIIVAVRAKSSPPTPFGMPHSWRQPAPNELPTDNHGITQIDPVTGNAPSTPYTNAAVDYFSEYVWHCHILGHEENDFMRPFLFKAHETLAPAPSGVAAAAGANGITVTWNDPTPVPAAPTAYNVLTNPTGFLGNPNNEIGFRVERAPVDANGNVGAYVPVAAGLHTINPITGAVNAPANSTNYVDPIVSGGALATPAAPALVSQTTTSVTLSLPALAAGGTGYNAFRNGVQVATNAPAGNWTDTGLLAGTTYAYTIQAIAASAPQYSYQVLAVTAAGDTVSTNTATATGAAPGNSAMSAATTVVMAPATPAGVTVTNPTASSLTVNWPAAAGATSYTVSMNGAPGITAASPDVVPGLLANTTYSFTVTAVNASGSSAPSAPASGLTLPGVSSGLAVTPGSITAASAALTWTAPFGGAAGYTVQWTTDATFATGVASLPAAATAATVTGLPGGTTVYFRVLALNASGAGAPSIATSALTLPVAPGLTLGAVTTTSVALTWTGSTGATAYTVQVSADGGATWTGTPAVVTSGTVVQNLAASTTYLFRVVASDATGSSTPSNVVTATTLAPTVAPGVPTCCTVTNLTATSLTLNWIAPATGPATSYTVQRATNASFTRGLQTTLNDPATSLAFTGLVSNVTYYFHVMAVNAVGSSAYSTTFSVTMPAVPAAPPAPAVALGPLSTTSVQSIVLTMPALPVNATSFTVYMQSRTGGGAAWSTATGIATGVTAPTFTFGAATAGLQYRFYLVAVGPAGSSTNGANSATVTPQELANAPTSVGATPVAAAGGRTRSVTVNWALGAANASPVTAVRILSSTSAAQAAPGAGQTNGPLNAGVTTSANLGATAVTGTVAGLARNTLYYFQVQVTTAGGNNYSTVVSAITAP